MSTARKGNNILQQLPKSIVSNGHSICTHQLKTIRGKSRPPGLSNKRDRQVGQTVCNHISLTENVSHLHLKLRKKGQTVMPRFVQTPGDSTTPRLNELDDGNRVTLYPKRTEMKSNSKPHSSHDSMQLSIKSKTSA